MAKPDVEAEVTLYSTAEGGRSTPVRTGYRPQHRVLPNYLSSGIHDYLAVSMLVPGQSTFATITFITPHAYPHALAAGDVVEISEGARIVGSARILRVLNPLLLRSTSGTDP